MLRPGSTMVENNKGLTKTYNRFHAEDERSPAIQRLRELHARMDRAVLDAYGWSDMGAARPRSIGGTARRQAAALVRAPSGRGPAVGGPPCPTALALQHVRARCVDVLPAPQVPRTPVPYPKGCATHMEAGLRRSPRGPCLHIGHHAFGRMLRGDDHVHVVRAHMRRPQPPASMTAQLLDRSEHGRPRFWAEEDRRMTQPGDMARVPPR